MDSLKALQEIDADDCIAEAFSKLNINLFNLDEFYKKFLIHIENPTSSEGLRIGDDLQKMVQLHISDNAPKTTRKKKGSNKENVLTDISQQSNIINESNTPENIKTDNEEPANQSGRPRRRAATNAVEKVSQQLSQSLRDKLRQENNEVVIKTERISNNTPIIKIEEEKQENVEMPPPAVLPKRAGRKKKEPTVKTERVSTRQTRARKTNLSTDSKSEDENESALGGKRSDVVLIQQPVQTINLDADDQNDGKNDENVVESENDGEMTSKSSDTVKTRGKPKKEAAKRTLSPSAERVKPAGRPKRTKRKASSERSTETSLYEDAVAVVMPEASKRSDIDEELDLQLPVVQLNRLSKKVMDAARNNAIANSTITITKPAILNETVTISKAIPTPPKTAEVDDIMTDDESEVDEKKKVAMKKAGTKQLFNPYENSPVKKKVEAFEKLGQDAPTASTTRVTRTKTRQKAKAEEVKKSEEDISPPSSAKPKAYVTPTASNRMQPLPASKTNLSNSAAKTLSAIKLSSQQYRDYERVRQEKEAEAQKKKQDMLMKLSEEKRKRREEKEEKAKQQRAALEEEKRRVAEQQKAKEEKVKQLLAEKQERLAKSREEAERKRFLAKEKCAELKREEERKRLLAKKREEEETRRLEEESRRLEEEKRRIEEQKRFALRQLELQREAENAKQIKPPPIYMTQNAPPLPTPDCYDSDDENAVKNPQLPAWNSKEAMHQRNRCMSYIDTKLRNTLFCVKAQTPNLQELLPGVDPRKLRRNSSAIWGKAPRFTMMPQMNDSDF